MNQKVFPLSAMHHPRYAICPILYLLILNLAAVSSSSRNKPLYLYTHRAHIFSKVLPL